MSKGSWLFFSAIYIKEYKHQIECNQHGRKEKCWLKGSKEAKWTERTTTRSCWRSGGQSINPHVHLGTCLNTLHSAPPTRLMHMCTSTWETASRSLRCYMHTVYTAQRACSAHSILQFSLVNSFQEKLKLQILFFSLRRLIERAKKVTFNLHLLNINDEFSADQLNQKLTSLISKGNSRLFRCFFSIEASGLQASSDFLQGPFSFLFQLWCHHSLNFIRFSSRKKPSQATAQRKVLLGLRICTTSKLDY